MASRVDLGMGAAKRKSAPKKKSTVTRKGSAQGVKMKSKAALWAVKKIFHRA